MAYRLYIDEVGNHDLASSTNPNEQYLSLTGIMLNQDDVAKLVQPQVEQLKQKYFESHPDDPIILHRKQLVQKKHPFHALRDPAVEGNFNKDLLELIATWQFTVFTVSIDKQEMLRRYTVWHEEPYHYCLKVLMERYVKCLERRGANGDVMAESRVSNLDKRLKLSFGRLYDKGTDYVPPTRIQARLTSKQLKLKGKQHNIAGLQLADLIAYPSFKYSLSCKNKTPLPADFTRKIVDILVKHKYDRANGRIDGIGYKWLP